jgi:hypothetical protein
MSLPSLFYLSLVILFARGVVAEPVSFGAWGAAAEEDGLMFVVSELVQKVLGL